MPKLPENIKLILTSTLPLVIVIILAFIAVPFGISKVSDLQAQIDTTSKNKTVLAQKLALLQSISTSVSQDSSTAINALPDKNVSLEALSQLKTISSQDGIVLSGIKTGSEVDDSSGTAHVTLSFQAAGGRSQILVFLQHMANIAPLTLVDKVKITSSSGSESAAVTLQSYWSQLPKTLPTLTTPIADLTTAEKKTLTSVETLTQPSFSVVPPSDGSGKTNPFSQ